VDGPLYRDPSFRQRGGLARQKSGRKEEHPQHRSGIFQRKPNPDLIIPSWKRFGDESTKNFITSIPGREINFFSCRKKSEPLMNTDRNGFLSLAGTVLSCFGITGLAKSKINL
jgi:hypothetical protein